MAQLAERLEKSEAGRKKLRQAISILQEKLAASENLFKANDDLQKECEQARQRAESEKKRAEEEKRLRVILEKDSATVKDQLAKVFQRLGAVENKQKTDKKQVERLQNEVKLSVEGMRVAAEAVDAVQSSLQSLETKLLEKVDAAFKEAHTVSETVHQLQTSFQSLQNSVNKKGSLPDKRLPLSATNPVSEKLVDEISRLFHKEKQSHCKIEQRLSKLRSVLKQDTWDNSLTTAEDSDLEDLAFSKMEEGKVSKKRKPGGKEELLNWKARKRSNFFDVDVVNSAATRSSVDVAKEACNGRSTSSPFSIECQMTSEEPRVPNTTSNECIGEAIVNHRGSSNGTAHMQMPSVGGKAQNKSQRSSFTQRENVDSGPDVIKGCLKNTCLQDGGIPKIQSEDLPHVMQHGTLVQLAGEEGIDGRGLNAGRSNADVPVSGQIINTNDASDSDLNFDDSDDEWWSQRVLLSPSLPDIPSPVHHSPSCSREPSLSKTDAYVPDATLDLDLSVILDVPVSDSHALTEVATSTTNAQGSGTQHGDNPVTVCLKQLEVSLQKDITVSSSSSLQPDNHSRVTEQQNKSGTNCQFVHAEKHTEMGSEGVQQSEQLGPLADKQGTEGEFQFNDEFGFEAVDSATIAEFDKFLEVLPPIPLTFSNEPSAFELPQVNAADAKPCEVIDLSNEVCISDQPQAASEMLTLRAVNTKDNKTIDCNCEVLCDGLQQTTNLSQNTSAQDLRIQDESHTFKATKDRETYLVSGSPYTSDPPVILSSSTKPSSSTVIFLVQAFDLQGANAELNVIAGCIMAINFKGYLRATTAEKEEMQLQGATLATGSASVPIEYMACSLISVVVDMVRLGNGEERCNSEAKPSFVLVQELVAFIRMMFKEQANGILDTTFVQLGRFLVQGRGMLSTLHGSLGFYEDVLSSARVFQEQKHHSHRYSEATLEDIHAGGKMISWDMLFVRSL